VGPTGENKELYRRWSPGNEGDAGSAPVTSFKLMSPVQLWFIGLKGRLDREALHKKGIFKSAGTFGLNG